MPPAHIHLIVALALLRLVTLAATSNASEPSALPVEGSLRVGAMAVDVTPTQFPVIVNGMFEERTADRDVDPLFARAFVLDDGATRIAIVVVDSCMLPRELLDEAKTRASKLTGHSGRPHADLGDAHALGAGVDGLFG